MDFPTQLWTVFMVLLSTQVSFSLKILSFDVPQTALRGQEVRLTCSYDLEGEKLYSVKWYRDDMEFFRFVPRDEPQQLYFPLEGIEVDFSRSTKQSIYIQNVQAETGGKFRCEVSADAPFFKTAAAEQWMSIQDTSGLSRFSLQGMFPVVLFAAISSILYPDLLW
ncbi:uncharacterized protein LOC106460316 [Limulus polyphemus]|uniref:Uncharacterized protein LOC106460316 n=1 Tax=Limulus polyphemus TaxID=6850 RepID=A0ABM1SGG5_LIMPO|nr:uncharacterized protein LOC106460316 [Limulus polyphemus]